MLLNNESNCQLETIKLFVQTPQVLALHCFQLNKYFKTLLGRNAHNKRYV